MGTMSNIGRFVGMQRKNMSAESVDSIIQDFNSIVDRLSKCENSQIQKAEEAEAEVVRHQQIAKNSRFEAGLAASIRGKIAALIS